MKPYPRWQIDAGYIGPTPRTATWASPCFALHPRRVGKGGKSSIALDNLVLNQSNPLSTIICHKTTPSTRSSNVSIHLFIMSSVTVPTLKLSTTGDAMPIVGTVGAVKTDCTESIFEADASLSSFVWIQTGSLEGSRERVRRISLPSHQGWVPHVRQLFRLCK